MTLKNSAFKAEISLKRSPAQDLLTLVMHTQGRILKTPSLLYVL